MNLSEAIKIFEDGLEMREQIPHLVPAYETAISAMQELQMYKDSKLCLIPEDVYGKQCEELDEYKKLGTIEEVREAMKEFQIIKSADEDLEYYIQELKQAKYDIETYWEEPTKLSKAMGMAIKVLKENQEYKQLGTLEEVQKAVEKQKEKVPTYDGDGYAPDGTFVWDEWLCPNCGTRYEVDYDDYDYCTNCGQHIDWREWSEEE